MLPREDQKEPEIFLQSYELATQIIQSTSFFPKPRRYVLGRKLEERSLEFLLLLNRLVGPSGVRFHGTDSKKAALLELSYTLDELRVLLRMARDSGAYSAGEYSKISNKTQSIGRQIGGMMRSNSEKRI